MESYSFVALLLLAFSPATPLQLFCHAFFPSKHTFAGFRTTYQQRLLTLPCAKVPSDSTKTLDVLSFEDKLLFRMQRNDTSLITVDGYVISKRSLGKSLMFVDFITEDGDLCQAMLREEYYSRSSDYRGYRRCLLKGTKYQVTGSASPTRNPGNVVFLISALKFLAFPRQIQHIYTILQQLDNGDIPAAEVALASPDGFQDPSQLLIQLPPDHGKRSEEMKKLARQIFNALPEYSASVNKNVLSYESDFISQPAPLEFREVPPSLAFNYSTNLSSPSPVGPSSLKSIQDIIECHVRPGTQSVLGLCGWVQNRRRFSKNITMISLVDDLTLLSDQNALTIEADHKRLRCVLHPDLTRPRNHAGLYRNLLAVGTKVAISGFIQRSDSSRGSTGSDVFWICTVRLVQSSSRSNTILHLLDLLDKGAMDLEEVGGALSIPKQSYYNLVDLDATQRRWKANALALSLQSTGVSKTSRTVVDPLLLGVLRRYQAVTEINIPIKETNLNNMRELASRSETPPVENGHVAGPLPHGMPGSKWQSKKRPQIAWMGEKIREVVTCHPDFGKRKLSILDIGGGKGSLAHYIGRTIEDVEINVLDICEGAVENGRAKAARLNLPVNFSLADASKMMDLQADIVVALHACGHLSDVALMHAVQRGANFVITPCCFNSNRHLTLPVGENKTLSVPDWLGIPEADWSALKLLAEVQGDIPLAAEAISTVCAIRINAAKKQLMADGGEGNLSIERFPIEFSTRNTVLVGKVSTCHTR